jgi:hypothetical protein
MTLKTLVLILYTKLFRETRKKNYLSQIKESKKIRKFSKIMNVLCIRKYYIFSDHAFYSSAYLISMQKFGSQTTNSTGQSSSEANVHSAVQEIPYLLWDSKVYCCVH